MKARIFNSIVAPMLSECSYREFRYELNKFGLTYKDTSCTVGHAVPSCKGGPDIGANLFAQFEQDNFKLGRKIVHKKELHQIHFQAWKKGLKSLYYCRSQSIQRAENVNNGLSTATAITKTKEDQDSEECLSCQ